MKEKLISIITPCYNGERFIDTYFDSILKSTYPNLEVIFVNDGSVDNTENKVMQYQEKLKEKKIKFIYVKQENGGLSSAINAGLKQMNGEFVIFHDIDDYYEPTAFSKMNSVLVSNQDYGVVRVNANVLNEKGKKIGTFYKKNTKKNEEIFEDLLYSRIPKQGFMYKTSILFKVYSNREIYNSRLGQNYQLLLPIVYKYKCGYIDECLFNYLVSKNSMSHDKSDIFKGLNRNKEVKNILTNVLTKMNLIEEYKNVIDIIELRSNLVTYALFKDKKIGNTYKQLKKKNGVTMKHRIIYYLARLNLFKLACFIYEKITKKVIA